MIGFGIVMRVTTVLGMVGITGAHDSFRGANTRGKIEEGSEDVAEGVCTD